MHPLIQEKRADIAVLCRRYRVRHLEVFGSAARGDDFDPAYREELRERYEAWVKERGANAFTPEQREWLDRMAEHIAISLAIESGDFEAGWFGQHGSLGKAHELFREQFQPLMRELDEKLAA